MSKQINLKNVGQCVAFAALVAAQTAAMADAAGGAGGLDTATTTAGTIRTSLYALLGVCAFIYLLYKGFMAFADKEQWSDFGAGVLKVVVVAGVPSIVTWAWGMYAS